MALLAAAPVLGIDFGTHDSKAAVVVGRRVVLVVDRGRSHVPSVVVVPARGPMQVGRRDGAAPDPARTITSMKRILGRAYGDSEVRALDQSIGYRLASGPDGETLIEVDGHLLSPVQLVAEILRYVRGLAATAVGRELDRVVLSVPVECGQGYRPALERAARLAGFSAVRTVCEPIAAGWGAGLPRATSERRVLVCDFGGGTFDCSLLWHRPQGLAVAGVAGDPFLGGDDLDSALADVVASAVYRSAGVELRNDSARWAEVVWRCEAAKRALSARPEARIHMPDAFARGGAWQDIDLTLQRSEVEPHWRPLIQRALGVTRDGLAAAGWHPQVLDDVLLVGGTNLVPEVRRAFSRSLGQQPRAVVGSDVVVAVGLALIGAAAAEQRPPAATPQEHAM